MLNIQKHESTNRKLLPCLSYYLQQSPSNSIEKIVPQATYKITLTTIFKLS